MFYDGIARLYQIVVPALFLFCCFRCFVWQPRPAKVVSLFCRDLSLFFYRIICIIWNCWKNLRAFYCH